MSELDLLRKIADLEARLSRLESDDRTRYSTGTWTPSFTGTGTAGTFTYTAQTGYYTRIGNLVFVLGYVSISAIATPPTGNMRVSGLPIAASGDTASFSSVTFGQIYNFNNAASAVQLTGYTLTGDTTIVLSESFDNAVDVNVPAANFTNASCALLFSCVYRA